MKSKEKKMIFILLVILVIAIVIFAVTKNKSTEKNESTVVENTVAQNNIVEEFVQVLDDGTKLNTSTKLNQAKVVNGFKFENIQFTEKNGQSVLLADVTNNTEKATDMTLVDVILLDKNGKEIVTLGGVISSLQPGEKKQFNTNMTIDYANAYDLKIVIK